MKKYLKSKLVLTISTLSEDVTDIVVKTIAPNYIKKDVSQQVVTMTCTKMSETFPAAVWVKMGHHECWMENNQVVDTAPTRRVGGHASVAIGLYYVWDPHNLLMLREDIIYSTIIYI